MLIHEIWEDVGDDSSVLPGLCLAGPDGEAFRKLLHRDARCTVRFEAGSYFEAMTIYYRLYDRGEYTTEFGVDHDPYPDEWAQRPL